MSVTSRYCHNRKSRMTRLARPIARFACVAMLGLQFGISSALAQASEDAHTGHHPGSAAPAGSSPSPSVANTPPANQGSAGVQSAMPQSPAPMAAPESGKPAEMGGMAPTMESMMGAKGSAELYPFLMSLPTLTPARRTEVERLASERIREGTTLLQAAQHRLALALETGDHAAADSALQQFRDAIGRVNAGVAAHRLIQDGTPPQSVASRWFKHDMGLLPATAPHGLFGLSWFHYFTMFIIAAFAVTMLGISFYKSKRAAALLTKMVAAPQSGGDQVERLSAPGADTPAGGVRSGAPGLPGAPAVSAAPAATAANNPDLAPSKPNSWTGPLMVGRIFQETPQVKTFRLLDPSGGKLPFNFLPGQFLTFTVSPNGRAIKRSYTIASSASRRDYCEVTVRHENRGLVSGYLNDHVHQGELLQVTAPSGKFTFAGQDGSSIVLIAGGVGVTPMMSGVRYLTDRSWPGDIYLIYGCKSASDVIFRDEIEYLARRYPNLHVTLLAEQADGVSWPYLIGRITKEILAGAVPDIVARHIHLCGPTPMMDAAKLLLAALGVPSQQIEVEVFVGKEVAQAPTIVAEQAVATPGETSPVSTVAAVATFARSNKTAALPPDKTILEAAEDVGVDIDYSCRLGTCGICKVKLLSGTVTMEVDDALTPADKTQNIVLACQAKATANVSVDA